MEYILIDVKKVVKVGLLIKCWITLVHRLTVVIPQAMILASATVSTNIIPPAKST